MSDVVTTQENPNEVAGIWNNQSQKGQEYLTSNLSPAAVEKLIKLLQSGATKLLAFKKKEKHSDSAPDWDLLFVEPGPKKQG